MNPRTNRTKRTKAQRAIQRAEGMNSEFAVERALKATERELTEQTEGIWPSTTLVGEHQRQSYRDTLMAQQKLLQERLEHLRSLDHLPAFVDLYIRSSSCPERFWDRWEDYCDERGIPWNQDRLTELVERAEQAGEIEQGELFVGTRGCW